MGYTIAVTRRRDRWDETDPATITLAEWAEIVAADPDLETIAGPRITPAPVTADGARPRYLAVRSEPFDGPDWSGMAQLTAHPGFPEHGGWLYWDRGAVVVKNPDEVLLAKLRQIAEQLGARVQGEEGEYYDGPGAVGLG